MSALPYIALTQKMHFAVSVIYKKSVSDDDDQFIAIFYPRGGTQDPEEQWFCL